MSDTTKQQMNAYRVRRALRDYQCYWKSSWPACGRDTVHRRKRRNVT